MKAPSETVAKRPAESVGAGAGTIGVAAALATHNWLALAVACAGYLPAIVTYLRANGGVRGVFGSLWGQKGESGYGIIVLLFVILLAALVYALCVALGLPSIVGIVAAILVLLGGAAPARW